MPKPTVAELQNRFETDLDNDTIQRMIDAAAEDVTSRYGEESNQVDELEGMGRILYLSRPADSITEVVETISDEDTTLVAADYEIRQSGWVLKRLDTGTNQRRTWGQHNKVTYVPEVERRRHGVIVDLVILQAQFSGLEESSTGDTSAVFRSGAGRTYHQQKEEILRTLQTRRRMIA